MGTYIYIMTLLLYIFADCFAGLILISGLVVVKVTSKLFSSISAVTSKDTLTQSTLQIFAVRLCSISVGETGNIRAVIITYMLQINDGSYLIRKLELLLMWRTFIIIISYCEGEVSRYLAGTRATPHFSTQFYLAFRVCHVDRLFQTNFRNWEE